MTEAQKNSAIKLIDELAEEWAGAFCGTPEYQMEVLEALHTVKECVAKYEIDGEEGVTR